MSKGFNSPTLGWSFTPEGQLRPIGRTECLGTYRTSDGKEEAATSFESIASLRDGCPHTWTA